MLLLWAKPFALLTFLLLQLFYVSILCALLTKSKSRLTEHERNKVDENGTECKEEITFFKS